MDLERQLTLNEWWIKQTTNKRKRVATKGDQLKGLLFMAATEMNLSEESWKCWIKGQNDPNTNKTLWQLLKYLLTLVQSTNPCLMPKREKIP